MLLYVGAISESDRPPAADAPRGSTRQGCAGERAPEGSRGVCSEEGEEWEGVKLSVEI